MTYTLYFDVYFILFNVFIIIIIHYYYFYYYIIF